MTKRPRPTMHGRDHATDGPDPIPNLAAGLIIADEGDELPSEPVLNFTGGGIDASWNPGADRIDVTVPTSMHMDADNTGGYFHAITSGAAADGYGTRLTSTGGDTAGAVGITSTGGSGIGLEVKGTTIAIKASTDGGSSDTGIYVSMTPHGNGIFVYCADGTGLDVQAGSTRFKVDNAGVHINTGTSILADL